MATRLRGDGSLDRAFCLDRIARLESKPFSLFPIADCETGAGLEIGPRLAQHHPPYGTHFTKGLHTE